MTGGVLCVAEGESEEGGGVVAVFAPPSPLFIISTVAATPPPTTSASSAPTSTPLRDFRLLGDASGNGDRVRGGVGSGAGSRASGTGSGSGSRATGSGSGGITVSWVTVGTCPVPVASPVSAYVRSHSSASTAPIRRSVSRSSSAETTGSSRPTLAGGRMSS